MTLTVNTWIPVGPAPIQDPIRGRLSYPEIWGDTLISGAVNGLAMVQGENGDGFLYIGAVNGGVWMRPYTYATDSWGEWTWQSKPSNDPNSGYQGIQSIAKIAVSPDNKYLAVGQGNPSNFSAYSSGNSKGFQIAKILEDGSLEWLILNPDISNLFVENKINIRDLDWVNDNLFIATPNQLAVVDVVEGEVSNLRILTQDPQEISLVQVTNNNHGDIYKISAGGFNYIDSTDTSVVLNITGDKLPDFYRSLGTFDNLRLSAYPELVNGQTVLFVGASQADKISFISRLILNGSELIDFETVNVQGDIGSGQGGGGKFYGNFSFIADPQDPLASRVLAGGNQYGGDNSPFTGGIVAIEFQPDGSTPQLVDWFGPRDGVIREEFVGGTAPHADSRSIIFYETPEGLKLIESDDGGIFQKGVDSQSPWTSLSGKGLQTLESQTGDWSNIGNQLISAIQDNSVAMGSYGDLTWINVYGGDGSLGFFDDASYQGDGFSRGYYSFQQYMSRGEIRLTTFDETGTWQSINSVNLITFDYDGNEVPIEFFEGNWFTSVSPNHSYPFGLPANSNPFRAGDTVFTGTRNIYEAVIPHWEVDPNEILLMPLLPESFESNSVKDFTALDVGSSLEEVSSFDMAKPYSWDDLYTAYYDSQMGTSYLLGRNGSESSTMLDPNSYQLQLIDSVQGLYITDITHYSDPLSNTDNLYYLATETSILYLLGENNPSGENNRLAVKIGDNEPIYYTYQELGLDPQVNLQTITLLPATDTHPQQLVVGGLGGLWISNIDGNGQPSTFSPMNWDGLPENIGPGSWNLDLEYDPVDDVVIANMLGHGAWIWSRSGEIDIPPEPDFGFSITSSLVPQSQSNSFDRRGRSVDGAISVQLHRTPEQLNQDITAQLVLKDPIIWQENIGLYADVSHTLDLTEGAIVDNQIRIPLTFVAGVDTLTFEFTTKRPDLVLPDITATMEVVSNDFPNSVAEGNITLFPNGVSPGYYETSTSGVFYNLADIAGSRNITAMMPSSLPQGTQVGIYAVNTDGSITNDEQSINPDDPNYLNLALENSLYLAFANNPQSNLALNSEKALNGFGDRTSFMTTEAQRYGNVQQADIAEGFTTGQTFALSLRFPDGSGLVSVGRDAFTIDNNADNTIIFDPNEEKLEVGLAPAGGGVFAAESSEYTLNIARLGAYNSGYGLFRVDNLTGDIDGLSPGTNDYAVKALERALSNSVDGFTGQNFPEYGQNGSEIITGLSENSYYGSFITPNRTINEALELLQDSSSLPSNNYVHFSIQQANQGIIAALPMGTGFFAFEDMGLTGDSDFNDILLQFIPNDSLLLFT
ncbi:DUF4114 domain-containing protein [Cyanobacterium aponinum]|uniref:DUF4114 domain-containing protein n=1 Tax=Cyanobacterium aponinum TaxID=379064 RepID=UPI000C12BDB0|nr:DUF4114 domain-containing protein [Cyanobacterium aponinum]PHV61641.1 hypothetical protein CSQ80_14420 [Cyanobacterium aponinum IPPAS B-1201]